MTAAPALAWEAAGHSPAVLSMARHLAARAQALLSRRTTPPLAPGWPGASKPRAFPGEDSGLRGRWAGWSWSSSSHPLPQSTSPSSPTSAQAPPTGRARCWAIHPINFLSVPRAETVKQNTNRHLETRLTRRFLILPPLATGLCSSVVSESPVSDWPCLSSYVTCAQENWSLMIFHKV